MQNWQVSRHSLWTAIWYCQLQGMHPGAQRPPVQGGTSEWRLKSFSRSLRSQDRLLMGQRETGPAHTLPLHTCYSPGSLTVLDIARTHLQPTANWVPRLSALRSTSPPTPGCPPLPGLAQHPCRPEVTPCYCQVWRGTRAAQKHSPLLTATAKCGAARGHPELLSPAAPLLPGLARHARRPEVLPGEPEAVEGVARAVQHTHDGHRLPVHVQAERRVAHAQACREWYVLPSESSGEVS